MSEAEKRSWLSPANCTCSWETALMLAVVGVAIYLLARSVFDVVFWVIISVCILYGLVYSYFKCCISNKQKSTSSSGYSPIPTGV